MNEKTFFVYILASKARGTLYVGMTNNLSRRVWEHRNKAAEGFTKRYGVSRLVWYELHGTVDSAITQEKRLKRWRRDWKIDLIEQTNLHWDDLFDRLQPL